MGRRSSMSIQKRIRERKKAEKKADKLAKKFGQVTSTDPSEPRPTVALTEILRRRLEEADGTGADDADGSGEAAENGDD